MADYHGGSLPPKPGPRTLGSRYILKNKTKCDWWTDDANAIYIWPLTITDFSYLFFSKISQDNIKCYMGVFKWVIPGYFCRNWNVSQRKAVFFNYQEQNQMLWRSFKKKTNTKTKKNKKKPSSHYHLQNYHCFFEICFRKTKILLLRILKQCQML